MKKSPAKRPTVRYKVKTFGANKLTPKPMVAITAPTIVTGRQPYLFTNALATGPMRAIKA